ncbi:MAG TPA: hypothetical protein VF403_00400 [Kofleriaceae bacterium]
MPKAKERPPLGGGTRKANAEEWTRVEAAGDAGDLPRLVAAIRDAQSPPATLQIKALAKRKDARLVEALLGFIKKPPYQGGQSKPFYSAVVEGLGATKSETARDEMIALSKRYKPVMNSFLGDYIASRLANTATKMLPKADAKQPAGMTQNKPSAAKAAKPAKTSLEALFAQIVAEPRSDGARAVYADAVSEKHDAHGEFITLQLARASGITTAKHIAREREMLREDECDAFALPLSTAADAVTFERGFPVAVYLKKSGLASVAEEPEWGTVEKLRGIDAAPITPLVKVLDGHAPNLVSVGTVNAKLLAKLKAPTYPWWEIELDHDGLDADALSRFPGLTRLHLTSRGPVPPKLLAAAPKLVSLDMRGIPNTDVLGKLALRHLGVGKETDDPVIVKRLPLESLHICRPIGELANWLEAAPTIVEVELECDGVDGEFDFAALKHVLAAKTKLVRLLITDWRMNAVELARRGPDVTEWQLAFPVSDRSVSFYERVVAMAAPMRKVGVTTVTLFPEQPGHYTMPFEDTDAAMLAAIDKAWRPLDVERSNAYHWPRAPGELYAAAPEEGWVLSRTRRTLSR